MRVKTSFVYPPIPDRRFDWAAYDDERGADNSPTGWGRTEQEAIADLLEQVEEREP